MFDTKKINLKKIPTDKVASIPKKTQGSIKNSEIPGMQRTDLEK